MSLLGMIFGAFAVGNAVKEKVTYFDDEAYEADSNNPNITISELIRRKNSGYYTKVLTPSNRTQKEIYELKRKLKLICDYDGNKFKNRKTLLWKLKNQEDCVKIASIGAEPLKEGVRTYYSMQVEELKEMQKRWEFSEKRLEETCKDFIRIESKLRHLDPNYKRTEEVEILAKNVEEFMKEKREK